MGLPGSRQFPTDPVIERKKQEMAGVVLADFLLLGHEKSTNYSAVVSRTSLFSSALGALLDSIASVINEYAVPRLMNLNQTPMELKPKLKHSDIENVDLAALKSYL